MDEEEDMYSRIVFEIYRRRGFSESALVNVLARPARYHGVRGRVDAQGTGRYIAVFEGQRDATTGYLEFIRYLETGIGELGPVDVTHHHTRLAFPLGIRVSLRG